MTREILGALEEGASCALRTYAALLTSPVTVTKSVVARAKRIVAAWHANKTSGRRR
jgi:hypothetical protein